MLEGRFQRQARRAKHGRFLGELRCVIGCSCNNGGEKGPVIFPAFKAGDSALRGSNGGFDFHTPPPQIANVYADYSVVEELSDLYAALEDENSQ
jgi:hypothetical protein